MTRTLLAIIISCGVLSARAALFNYSVTLNGPNEPSTSPGVGVGLVSYDNTVHSLQLQVTFFGLVTTNASGGTSGAGTTVSHIHAATVNPFSGTAGVATTTPTFAGFPTGVFAGSYSNTLNLTLASSWNPAYITANGGTPTTAEAALASAMDSGRSYWNIHSAAYPGGEIRGFLTPTVVVPEPSTVALLGLGGIAIGVCTLGRRREKNR